MSASRVAIGAGVLLSSLAGACSPLTATIGYEELDSAVAPEPDAADPPEPDAATPDRPDAGSLQDANTQEPDARPNVPCWHLPDVVNARKEAGVERVENDDVFGATDEALGCLDGGTPSDDPVPITYQRNDLMPLLLPGLPYALITPVGPTAFLINFHPGEVCKQGPIPNLINSSPFGRSCGDFSFAQGAKSLRFILAAQTPLPMGLTLCQARCSEVPP